MTINQIRRSLNNNFLAKQDRLQGRPGQLGDGNGNLTIAGVDNYVWCRVAGQPQIVFNNRVPAQNDLLVMVGEDPIQPGLLQVLSTRSSNPGGIDGGVIAGYAPALRYQWMADGGGQDPLWVEKRQFLPLRVGPYSGMIIQVYRDLAYSGTDWLFVDTSTHDLSSYIPSSASQAAFVLVTIDATGTVVLTKGTETAITSLDLSSIPAIPMGTKCALAAVRVYYGQAAVQEGRTNTDIVDLRFAEIGIGGGISLPDPPDSAVYYDGSGHWSTPPTGEGTDLVAILTTPGDLLYRGPGPENMALASLGASTSDSIHYYSSTASMVIDGNASTYWWSGPAGASGEWVRIDLGQARAIGSYYLDQTQCRSHEYKLQYSTDDSAWLDAYDRADAELVETIVLPTSHTARYWRILIVVDGGFGSAINELRLLTPDVPLARLGIGDEVQVLTVESGFPSWQSGVDIASDDADIAAINFTEQSVDLSAPGSGHTLLYFMAAGIAKLRNAAGTIYNLIVNPMTAQDDLIVGGASGAPAKLTKGSDSQVLTVDVSDHHVKWMAASGGVARSGSTTDGHIAVWNGSSADSIKDGGALSGGGNVSDTGSTTANHLAVWNGTNDHTLKDGGAVPVGGGGGDFLVMQVFS